MKKGGYQIIDLSAYKFTNGESQSVPNVYNIIKNTKKVVLISGLTVDGTEYHDMFTVFIPYETYFYGLTQYEGNNIYFVVDNDGRVRVSVSANAIDSPCMSYNGVTFPALPDWNREEYPYAMLYGGTTADDPTYGYYGFLYLSTTKFYLEQPGIITKLYPENNGNVISYVWDVTSGDSTEGPWRYREGEDITVTIGENVSFSGARKWTNFDLYNRTSETVAMEATEPIPSDCLIL